MGGFIKEVQENLLPVVEGLPDGYFLEFGGQFENQQRSMRRLSVVVPISIALIFLMLFSAFGSLRSALLVLSNLPFALVGGVLTILILNINLSVSAAIGFIAVFGIAVEDGTVMVSFFDRFRREGLSPLEAVEKGCHLRFTSVLMTTLTTLLGLTPMFFATGSGSEIQRPLAAVVLGGLASALVLTLLVLPALYSVVEERAGRPEDQTG
jgi:cobalt-zinc-cadmium resistance protein CzcA